MIVAGESIFAGETGRLWRRNSGGTVVLGGLKTRFVAAAAAATPAAANSSDAAITAELACANPAAGVPLLTAIVALAAGDLLNWKKERERDREERKKTPLSK